MWRHGETRSGAKEPIRVLGRPPRPPPKCKIGNKFGPLLFQLLLDVIPQKVLALKNVPNRYWVLAFSCISSPLPSHPACLHPVSASVKFLTLQSEAMRRAANVFVVPQHRIVLSKLHDTFSAVMSHLLRQLSVWASSFFYVAAKWGNVARAIIVSIPMQAVQWLL